MGRKSLCSPPRSGLPEAATKGIAKVKGGSHRRGWAAVAGAPHAEICLHLQRQVPFGLAKQHVRHRKTALFAG